MVNYKVLTDAENDIGRLWEEGVRKYGERQADIYLSGLFKRFEKIAENPFLYQSVDHVRVGYRRSVYGSDSIYYRVNDDIVEIINIVGRQDFKP